MYYTHFTYNGQSTDEHDVIICSFDGGNSEATSGGKIEITNVKAPNANTWSKTNAAYKEPLSFTFSICKNPCLADSKEAFIFSPSDQIDIRRWLECKEYHDLCFDSEDMENIYFRSYITLTEQKQSGHIIGYNLTVTCDAPWGWSEKRIAHLYSQKDSSGKETGVVEIFDSSEEIGSVTPYVELTAIDGGTIELHNENTNDTTIIENCAAGEVITLTSSYRISSDRKEHEHLNDDFNWVFPRIQNSYKSNRNTFELGNCTAKIIWREPRKAVM